MNLIESLDEPIIKNNADLVFLTKGVLLAAVVGAAAVYFMIPERKRKTVFK